VNILILNWRDPKHPLAGGAEVSLFEHAKYWKDQGAKITWFASDFQGAARTEQVGGITILRKGSHFTVHLWAYILYLKGIFKSTDVVIDNFHFLPFFTPVYFKNTKKIAFIHEIAGKLWYKNLPYILAAFGYYSEKFFFKFYKNVPFITVSESTKNELTSVGIQTRDITIIHNGISLHPVSDNINKEAKPTLLFLGRISKDKGIADAIEAFVKVSEKVEDAHLWIVGKEEKSGTVTSFMKQHSEIKNKVEYYGFVSEEKKTELLKRAWILIHPSHKEGWGLTVIEAASQGTPTVGYNVAGLRDSVLDKKTGVLTTESPVSMANAIVELVQDQKILKSMSETAGQYAKGFDWKESGKRSWEVLTS
jgi:glycosyltransferase involved in cell wall biosynthesis